MKNYFRSDTINSNEMRKGGEKMPGTKPSFEFLKEISRIIDEVINKEKNEKDVNDESIS